MHHAVAGATHAGRAGGRGDGGGGPRRTAARHQQPAELLPLRDDGRPDGRRRERDAPPHRRRAGRHPGAGGRLRPLVHDRSRAADPPEADRPVAQPARQPVEHHGAAHHQVREAARRVRAARPGLPDRHPEGVVDPRAAAAVGVAVRRVARRLGHAEGRHPDGDPEERDRLRRAARRTRRLLKDGEGDHRRRFDDRRHHAGDRAVLAGGRARRRRTPTDRQRAGQVHRAAEALPGVAVRLRQRRRRHVPARDGEAAGAEAAG